MMKKPKTSKDAADKVVKNIRRLSSMALLLRGFSNAVIVQKTLTTSSN